MKVIVAGSREITQLVLIERAVKESGFPIDTVISGCCRGTDRLGEQYAKQNNLQCIRIPAEWGKYGKSAGPRRNREMEKVADAAVILILDDSTGSTDMMEVMREANKPFFILYLESFFKEVDGTKAKFCRITSKFHHRN